ncbi:protein kinase domain-containing protein [Flindersiella endophytica]
MEPLQSGDPGQVGGYDLLARLGDGGMGVVFLGRSPAGRTVAVKLIHRRFVSDAEYRARFRREVAAARKVTGPFTAPVLAAGPDDPLPWLATAYLPGPSLGTALRIYGALPPGTVRLLGAGLAEALTAIHRAGLVHRDLKPGNVLLTTGGPRVIDFGIARPDDATTLTQVGTLLGTPGYMSPEQIRGGALGPPSDLFSLGAVLAYATSGAEPFGSGPPAERLRRTQEARADLAGIGDPLLRELVAACLHREPGSRPTAEEVLQRLGQGTASLHGTSWLPPALAELVERTTVESRRLTTTTTDPRPGPTSRPPPGPASVELMAQPTGASAADDGPANGAPAPPGRGPLGLSRRALVGGGLGVAGLAAIGGLAAFWPDGEQSRPSAASPSERATSPAGIGTRTPSRRPSATTEPRPTPTEPPRATPAWRTKVGSYYPDLSVADGIVIADLEDDLAGVDPRTRKVVWRKQKTFSAAHGDRVYLADDQLRVRAIRPSTGATVWSYSPPFGRFPGFDLVVAGSLLCFGSAEISAVSATTGRLRWTSTVSAQHGLAAGDGVLVAYTRPKLVGLSAKTGARLWTHQAPDSFGVEVEYGRAYTTDEYGVTHALDVRTGKQVWEAGVVSYGMCGGGGRLYFSNWGGYIVCLRPGDGKQVWKRRIGMGEGGEYGRLSSVGFAEGVLYVGCTDRNVYALDAATGSIRWTYPADMTLKSGPVATDGLVFAGIRDGSVLALRPPAASGGTRAGS